jgi:hypothetical protein
MMLTKTYHTGFIFLHFLTPLAAFLIPLNNENLKGSTRDTQTCLIFCCTMFTISNIFYWVGVKRHTNFNKEFWKIAEQLSNTTNKVLHSFCDMGSIPNYIYEKNININPLERENLLLSDEESNKVLEEQSLIPEDFTDKIFKVSNPKSNFEI